MRKITNREKVVLALGVLAVVAIAIYFLFPIFAGKQSKSSSNLKQLQEKLELVQSLKEMEPMLSDLEESMKARSGYGDMTFSRVIADSIIMKYVAQLAAQSEIREIDQLDAKIEKKRKTQATVVNNQAVLKPLVDQLYLVQIVKNLEASEQKPSMGISKDEKEEIMLFPVIPKDISEAVKQSLMRFLENNHGKTPTNEDIDDIVAEAKATGDSKSERSKKKLELYSGRLRSKKNEISGMLGKINIVDSAKLEDKAGRYTVNMVFKSEMPQLVKLLYNLQTTAKWIKVDGMQVTLADRRQTLLNVNLSMTATVLYEQD